MKKCGRIEIVLSPLFDVGVDIRNADDVMRMMRMKLERLTFVEDEECVLMWLKTNQKPCFFTEQRRHSMRVLSSNSFTFAGFNIQLLLTSNPFWLSLKGEECHRLVWIGGTPAYFKDFNVTRFHFEDVHRKVYRIMKRDNV